MADALFLPRAAASLLAFFGALGLLLAAVGILGVIAYLARARTREIGLRLALGATRGAILRWLLRRGLAPVAAGLAVGVAAAVSAAWGLSRFFTGIWPTNLHALLVAVSLLASPPSRPASCPCGSLQTSTQRQRCAASEAKRSPRRCRTPRRALLEGLKGPRGGWA